MSRTVRSQSARYTWAVAACLLAGCAAASAQTPDFDRTAGFPVRIGEREILRQQSEPLPPAADRRRAAADQAVTFIDSSSRREFARSGDKVEFTFEYRLPASEKGFSYELEIPLERGSKAEITHGSSLENQTTEWTADATGGRLEAVRFLRIDAAAQSFSIDTDPAGAWQNSSDYDKPLRTCIVEKSERGLRLRFVRGGNRYGGARIMGKLVIHPQPARFEQVHPFHRSGYKLPLARQRALAFTSGRALKGFDAAGLEPYEKGHGWTKTPPGLQLVRRGGEPAVHRDFVTGAQPSVFRIDALPGWHFVTLAIGDREQPVGPMQVKINGKDCVRDLALEAGRFVSPHFAVEALDGRIELELSGARWVLNGVFVQPIMTKLEDFQLSRAWWNQEIDWPERAGD